MIVFCGKQETLGYVPQYKEFPCSSTFKKHEFAWAVPAVTAVQAEI